jgi:hypothetical protein
VSVLATPVGVPAADPRPSAVRRALLAGAGFLACALPLVFTVNLTRMLLVGELPGHRFHQLTGQGLILTTLWLAGLVPLLRAGWAGRAPRPSTVLLHAAFVATGVACTVAAPLGGAPFLLGVVLVTGLLVHAALPVRVRLRDLEVRVAPAALTTSLVLAAVSAPYVVEQLGLQRAATGHHAANPHFFDMAWLLSALVALALVSAFVVPGRSLLTGAAAGTGLTGAAMLAFGQGTGTGWMFVVTGLALLAARLVDGRAERV